MDCVDGHGLMLERRIAGQVVDQCAVCQGMWLDPGELWRALGRPVRDEDHLRRQLVFEGLNMERDCPACSTPLSNATVGTVAVSACMDCSGLWLDDAAVETLKTYRPRVQTPAVPIAAPPLPIRVPGVGIGQVESDVWLIGEVMEGLTIVLWSVVTGLYE